MVKSIFLIIISSYFYVKVESNEVLGCGGFIKSHVSLDFSKVEVRLITKQGIVKDRTNCAPNNGYYFVPLYDKGELILELIPPPGWSFAPKEVYLNIDGTDDCSLGKDINFIFEGFGITGKVDSLGAPHGGPEEIAVNLISKDDVRIAYTHEHGNFFFSPVYPGSYNVSISHPRWQIYKNSINVKVTEGNTELPEKSLIVQGYDVTGKILTVEGNPVKDAIIALLSKDEGKVVSVDKCQRGELSGFKYRKQFLCYTISDEFGEFLFPVIPYGDYVVVPYYRENNIYYQPEKILFSVGHGGVELTEHFKILGFSVSGKVTNGKNKGIPKAKIFLNGQNVAITDSNGLYKLEKLKVGKYKLKAEAGDLMFEEASLNIDINTKILPDLKPSAFKVCGEVTSDKPQIVTFSQIGSTKFVQTETNSQQQFCEYLSPGKYEIQVIVSEEDKKKGIQFFPLRQTIEITGENILDLLFSQLKSNISGKVDCIVKSDFMALNVIFKSGSDQTVVPVMGSSYSSSDMQPGLYEISLSSNRFCWKVDKHTISVNSVLVEVPPFVQTGYLLNFVSSHDAKVMYNALNQGKLSELEIPRGRTSICLNAPGEYTFSMRSCHIYEKDTFTYNTNSENNQITLNALKHTVIMAIESDANYGPIKVEVVLGNIKNKQQINYANGKYELQLMLQPGEITTVTPHSDLLVFTPPNVEIEGSGDCENLGTKIIAKKGKVFQGHVQPPLAGVLITVEGLLENKVLTRETDSNGFYKFPALDNKNDYQITARKESYIIIGPDSYGNFKAQKLAEIIVEVIDQIDKAPLAGVLLSLSGGESYRRNLQTDSSGKIIFYSLSASDYFLRPMMKEYQFEPATKLVAVNEGKTVNVQLIGKRVAFSAFGKVTSLNEDPIKGVNIIASGLNNCTSYSEEATTDAQGLFRIRGLQPFCSFKVFIQVVNTSEIRVERTSPDFIEVKNINDDVQNLHFIVFHPVIISDVLVKVYTEIPEHYRSLKLKLFRETEGPVQLYSTAIENSNTKVNKERNYGILMHLPSLQIDRKVYSVHLESSYNKAKSQVEYFIANTSLRYIEMDFNVKSNIHDQPIKQTSIWAVIFIFIVIFSAYNIHIILDFVKEHVNINFSNLINLIPVPNNSRSVSNYDNDIDQIVQDINNVKRNRSKKNN